MQTKVYCSVDMEYDYQETLNTLSPLRNMVVTIAFFLGKTTAPKIQPEMQWNYLD